MKKTYISPSVEIIRLTPANIIATSNIGVSGETDEECTLTRVLGHDHL